MTVPLSDVKHYTETFVLWVVLKTATFREQQGDFRPDMTT